MLDTQISDKENPLSIMYHSLYAYTEILGYPALLKLKIEESVNEKNGEPIRRDYILQNIKEEPISIGKRFSKAHLQEKDSSVISIADLFDFVKTYDKEFKPKSVNKAMLNDDGTPKIVYHGTNVDFTEFDLLKSGKNPRRSKCLVRCK